MSVKSLRPVTSIVSTDEPSPQFTSTVRTSRVPTSATSAESVATPSSSIRGVSETFERTGATLRTVASAEALPLKLIVAPPDQRWKVWFCPGVLRRR